MQGRGWIVFIVGISAIFLHHVFVTHSRRNDNDKPNGGEEMEPGNQDELGYAKKPKKRSQKAKLMNTGPLKPPSDPPGGNAENLVVSALTQQHTKVHRVAGEGGLEAMQKAVTADDSVNKVHRAAGEGGLAALQKAITADDSVNKVIMARPSISATGISSNEHVGWQTAEDPASGKTYYDDSVSPVTGWNSSGTETESSLLGLNAGDSQESANSLKKQTKTLQTQKLQVLGLSRALAPDRVNDIISKYYHPEFAHQAKQKLVNGIGTGNEASVFRSIDISLQLPQGVLDHDQKRSVNVVDGQKNILSPNGEKFRIYAAGIADNSAFEESMAEAGCEVHAFDCTISHQAKAVAGKQFTFHETCLGVPASFENNGYTAHQNKTYEFKLLSQAMAELGHKSIDILKFDIEGFEWNLFETDLLKEEVLPKQLAFELHTENANPQYVPPQQVKDKDATAVNTLFLKLYDLGYRVVSKEVNPGDEHCAEFVLVNINEALIAPNALGDPGPISAPQNAVTSLTSLKTWQDPRIDSIIPDRLVGNYYINFMKRSTDIDDFQKVGGEGMSWKLERMRANIRATMKINNFTEKQIEWADDQDCADLIEHLHSKELRAAFAREQRGEYKSDICRLAQLAENGGYYVDNDMAALEAIHQYIPAHASFVSVIAAWNSFGDRDLQGENTKNIRDEMFNSFIGVAPGHPIIQKALNLTLEHYSDAQKQKEQSALVEIRSERSNWLLGPYILRQAYEWWADLPLGASISLAESYHPTKPTKFQYSYLLDETKIDNEYVVRDHKTGTAIFKSRIEVLS